MAGQKWILFFTFLVLFAMACTGTTITICEHGKRTISCPSGETIKVSAASYGRHDHSTCPHSSILTTNCDAGPSSLFHVKNRCENKPSCELFASNSVFGDPCVGTYKYLTVTYTCVPTKSILICEHHTATLQCPAGTKISVLYAFYGRYGSSICSHQPIHNINCHAEHSGTIVRGRCQNKSSCWLYASNSLFGDPCIGTYKYLLVRYQCI